MAHQKLASTIFANISLETTLKSSPAQTIGICANARWNQSAITVAGGNGLGQGLNQFNSPDGIFLTENGTIYITDGFNSRIMRWDVGVSLGRIVAGGNGEGNSVAQLNFPVDLVVDSNGSLYISDFGNNRVQKWLQGASNGETILSNLNFTGIGQDDEGSLYTSDWKDYVVRKWPNNDTVGQILASGFILPDRLFVDRNRSVYVVDRRNHLVIRIDQDTGNISVVAGGRQGQSMSALNLPRSVTVDELGNVYVADTMNHRIVRWSPGATLGIPIVGGRDSGSGFDQLHQPTDLQFDQYGNLYVADSGNNRIQKFIIDKSLC